MQKECGQVSLHGMLMRIWVDIIRRVDNVAYLFEPFDEKTNILVSALCVDPDQPAHSVSGG